MIGPFGIDNMNMKDRILMIILIQNIPRVANSYFNKPSFVTWRSFNASRSPHMLDLIMNSNSFFKYMRDCGVTPTGMRRAHLTDKDRKSVR